MARAAHALVPASLLLISQLALAQTEPPPAEPAPEAQPTPAQPPGKPPAQYYVEPSEGQSPPPAAKRQPPPGTVYEPPPPGYYAPTVYEPPPPPKPRHTSPKTSFWLGARLGWFVPFGDLWASAVRDSTGTAIIEYEPVSWSEYGSSGPMFEIDAGARLGRYYNVFLLWERAQLGTGSEAPDANGGQLTGDTDFYAIGLRVTSDADKVGFLTEIDLGYRRFRARWEDGTELHLTEAPLEFRLGLGADIRLSPIFALSPMVTLGVGSFGSAEWQDPNGDTRDATAPGDRGAGHGWITLQMGGHFDLAGGG